MGTGFAHMVVIRTVVRVAPVGPILASTVIRAERKENSSILQLLFQVLACLLLASFPYFVPNLDSVIAYHIFCYVLVSVTLFPILSK